MNCTNAIPWEQIAGIAGLTIMFVSAAWVAVARSKRGRDEQ